MAVFAHATEEGRKQLLSEHLENVAKLAASFVTAEDGRHLRELAAYVGLMHDIGKYQSAFQRRLDGARVRVDHSISGAREAIESMERVEPEFRLAFLLAAYCVAGHHTGLGDFGYETDAEGSGSVQSRLKSASVDYGEYREAVILPEIKASISGFATADLTARYLFSCLVDADYLDTEAFCDGKVVRGTPYSINLFLHKLDDYRSKFRSDTPIRQARARLQLQVDGAPLEGKIFYLNMPTGSGKTISSLSFALKLARAKNKRVIYVIPFTSIIEQTSAEFKEIFGGQNVLEHHSDLVYEQDDRDGSKCGYDEKNGRLRRATENWDAPIVVTTAVQFFESIYKNKSSKLRKMHNMGDSVIVFDEIQLMPVRLLSPCYAAISYLTEFAGAQAILMSATMPNLESLSRQLKQNWQAQALIADRSDYSVFRTSEIQWLGEIGDEVFSDFARRTESLLIVSPTRKETKRIYACLRADFGTEVFHLSTYMNATHRRATIAKIKERLRAGIKTIVVSTSLIEAGVDLDFACVMRAITGLDSILQSAGRCNREGKRSNCYTYVFTNEATDRVRDADLKQRAAIAKRTFERFEDVQSQAAIEYYFEQLFDFQSETVKQMRRENFQDMRCRHRGLSTPDFKFASYAEAFDFIESGTRAVVAPYDADGSDSAAKIVASYRAFPTRELRRAMQSYAVNVYENEFRELVKNGAIAECEGVWILTDPERYNLETGLQTEGQDKLLCI